MYAGYLFQNRYAVSNAQSQQTRLSSLLRQNNYVNFMQILLGEDGK